MKIVSACLAGCRCRYDQGSVRDRRVARLVSDGLALPLCPEQMGGLPTPRLPAEVVGGTGEDVLNGTAQVIDAAGCNQTARFIAGAHEVLRTAQAVGAKEAILKERSPSCGSSVIYDGSFTGTKKPGVGVTAALLRRHGIHVSSETD